MAFTSLAHHIDIDWLREAYHLTRKEGAPGIDGETATEYGAHLEDNLQSLLDRAKSGRYRAPAVRRVHIPKGDGRETRPIGVPTFEDKVLQRAVVMVLEPLYEQDFLDCSYGFRPVRSAHQALGALRDQIMEMGGAWLVEVDIRKFFDTLDHAHLRTILRQRVRDGVILKLIGKWLNAGVLEGGRVSYPDMGTPQGGVISPLLANIYLNEVLDAWFEGMVRPVLRGRAFLVRYADDFVMGFEREDDARRVLAVLPKRFAKYGLTLHPTKTRLVPFRRPAYRETEGRRTSGPEPGTFNFLGFTHIWRRSRRGFWVVQLLTARDRFTRSLKRVSAWCRAQRHLSIPVQHTVLAAKLVGYYGYFALRGNSRRVSAFRYEALKAWFKWLRRRAQRRSHSWPWFLRLLEVYPLPLPKYRALGVSAANP